MIGIKCTILWYVSYLDCTLVAVHFVYAAVHLTIGARPQQLLLVIIVEDAPFLNLIYNMYE